MKYGKHGKEEWKESTPKTHWNSFDLPKICNFKVCDFGLHTRWHMTYIEDDISHLTAQQLSTVWNTSGSGARGSPSRLDSLRERCTDRAAAAGVFDDSSLSAGRRAANDARLLGSFSLTSSGRLSAAVASLCGDGGGG